MSCTFDYFYKATRVFLTKIVTIITSSRKGVPISTACDPGSTKDWFYLSLQSSVKLNKKVLAVLDSRSLVETGGCFTLSTSNSSLAPCHELEVWYVSIQVSGSKELALGTSSAKTDVYMRMSSFLRLLLLVTRSLPAFQIVTYTGVPCSVSCEAAAEELCSFSASQECFRNSYSFQPVNCGPLDIAVSVFYNNCIMSLSCAPACVPSGKPVEEPAICVRRGTNVFGDRGALGVGGRVMSADARNRRSAPLPTPQGERNRTDLLSDDDASQYPSNPGNSELVSQRDCCGDRISALSESLRLSDVAAVKKQWELESSYEIISRDEVKPRGDFRMSSGRSDGEGVRVAPVATRGKATRSAKSLELRLLSETAAKLSLGVLDDSSKQDDRIGATLTFARAKAIVEDFAELVCRPRDPTAN